MTINSLIASVDEDAQNMFKGLMDDIIQAVGTEFYYIPKDRIDVDILLREDIHRVYKDYYLIEGYIKNKDQLVHSINMQTKYGDDYREYMTLCITRNRFHEVLPAEFIRPKTGDLIYSPVYKGVYTINYTEHETPFYQLQQLTFYELYLERYVYNQDTLETGLDDVDNIQYEYGYQVSMKYTNLVGTFLVGDKVTQIFDGITISGKVADIDIDNNIITLTDINSTDELYLNFVSSETYLIYDTIDVNKKFEVVKIYDLDNADSNLDDNGLVLPNSSVGINQELEEDIKDYVEKLPSNPFWG